MEASVPQNLTTTSPLSTISPHRVNNTADTSARRDMGDEDQAKATDDLRQQENRILQQLRERDREVRAHEAAHVAAGRPYIRGGPSYVFQRGPDGRSYAIGGNVHLDTSEVAKNPKATLDKAETVQRAALAPIEPSPQDMRVAANAAQMAAQARIEIAVMRREEQQSQVADRRTESRDNNRSSNASVQPFGANEPATSTFEQFA